MKDIIKEFAAKVKQLVAAAEDIPLKDLIGILLGNPNGTLAAIVVLAKAHPITVIGAMDDLKKLEIKEETNLILLYPLHDIGSFYYGLARYTRRTGSVQTCNG